MVCAVVWCAWVVPFLTLAQTNVVYMSPCGNDAWSGLLAEPNMAHTDGPVASLEGARNVLRRLRSAVGREWPSRVEVGAGTYALEVPLTLV